MNERIRIAQVRVIDELGTQLGVMNPLDAVKLARERGLDLVEVSPQATPPVCRIMDFNKFKYEQTKREREAKKKHHIARLKEVKFKPHIEAHDYQVKLQQLRRFLMRGDKAKISLMFRGREMAHVELGQRVFERLTKDIADIGRVERDPYLEGRFMTMVLMPDAVAVKRLQRQHAKQSATTSAPRQKEEPAPSSSGAPTMQDDGQTQNA